MLNALILAGAQPVGNHSENANKALLRINGKMMVEYVIEALRGVEGIGRIVAVGSEQELALPLAGKVDAVLHAEGSIMAGIDAGVRNLGSAEPILICTSDIPMITSEGIKDFIGQALALEADLCYPIVDERLNREKYPEMERTYVPVREGRFTGGNIFYVHPKVLEKGFSLASRLVEARKNPLKMAGLLGLGFLFRFITGTLSIAQAERKISKMLQIKARAVISQYPEIGNDVDKPSDVMVATAYLSR